MKAIIYKVPERYIIADLDTGKIIGYQSTTYRARQEAANLDAEEIIECRSLPPLSIMHTEDLQLALSSGVSQNSSESEEASGHGSSSQSSGLGRAGNSGKGRRKKSIKS